jgi:hypothetical protein
LVEDHSGDFFSDPEASVGFEDKEIGEGSGHDSVVLKSGLDDGETGEFSFDADEVGIDGWGFDICGDGCSVEAAIFVDIGGAKPGCFVQVEL